MVARKDDGEEFFLDCAPLSLLKRDVGLRG